MTNRALCHARPFYAAPAARRAAHMAARPPACVWGAYRDCTSARGSTFFDACLPACAWRSLGAVRRGACAEYLKRRTAGTRMGLTAWIEWFDGVLDAGHDEALRHEVSRRVAGGTRRALGSP